MSDPTRAVLALLGVATVTLAWVWAGLVTEGFDPVRQSISQLQRDGTATGAAMTVAFLVFAIGALAISPVLGRRLGRAPQVVLTVAAVATLGAAAAPLGEVRGGAQDAVHLTFGTAGYAALSVLPLLAGWALRIRSRRAAGLSFFLGAVASGCLLGTVPADDVSGALQRVGFLAGHLWLAGFAVVVLVSGSCAPDRGSDPRARRRRTPWSPR
ncbi:MAG: DUF998 domain-containing protein [Mycobacteriales bacterium]